MNNSDLKSLIESSKFTITLLDKEAAELHPKLEANEKARNTKLGHFINDSGLVPICIIKNEFEAHLSHSLIRMAWKNFEKPEGWKSTIDVHMEHISYNDIENPLNLKFELSCSSNR